MENSNLQVTSVMKKTLLELSKWSKLMAIIGFVSIGFMVLGALFLLGASSYSPLMRFGGVAAFIYIVIAVIYYFPVMYLYRFSTKLKKAIDFDNQEYLAESFVNLKSHYKFIGIFTLSIFGFYFVIAFIGLMVRLF